MRKPSWVSWDNAWRSLFYVLGVVLTVTIVTFAVLNVVSRAQDKARIQRLQDVIDNQYATINQGACYDAIEFEYESAAGEFFIVITDAIIGDNADPPIAVDPQRFTRARDRLARAEDRLSRVDELCPTPDPPKD